MSQLVIVVIVVLLPGILATSIADKLTVHSAWDSFKFPLYALLLGVLTYSLLQLLVYGWNILAYAWNVGSAHRSRTIEWTTLTIWNVTRNGNSPISALEIVAAVLLAIPVSFIASACVYHKVISTVGHWMHVTSKYGDENLYFYFMNMKDNEWIYVRDKENNLTYEGRAGWHSASEHVHELVLDDVTVYRYEDSARLYSVPTVYLSREIGKLVIETVPRELLQEDMVNEYEVGN
jgi:hypothetical protein